MSISVTIMGHPKRDEQIQKLLIQLVDMPFSDVSVTLDNKNSEWDTGRRSLLKGVNKGDWHVVLQDDAILTPDFYENLQGAIRAVPVKVLISLYVGTVKPMPERVKEAVDKATHATWLKHNMLFWGVGIAIPSDHILPLVEFVDEPMYDDTQYDTRIGMFYQRNMLPVYYTMPSLVDHDDDLGSLLGHDTDLPPRKAHRLATSLVSWNDEAIDL